jgi:hypothetical protein
LREAYTSYPILAFYRCQREEDSWLSSLTAILDAAALVESCFTDGPPWQRALAHQARLTGEMGQVTLAGLSRGLAAPKADPRTPHRLPPEKWLRLHADLVSHGVTLPAPDDPRAWSRFQVARARYEPYVVGLAARIRIDLGTWWIPGRHDDGDAIADASSEESTQDMYLAVLNAHAAPGEAPRN